MAGDKSLGNRMNSATKVPFGDRTNCEPNGDEEDAKAAKKREQARERTRRWQNVCPQSSKPTSLDNTQVGSIHSGTSTVKKQKCGAIPIAGSVQTCVVQGTSSFMNRGRSPLSAVSDLGRPGGSAGRSTMATPENVQNNVIMASIDSEVSTQLPMSVLTENQVCVTPIIGSLKRKIEHHHSFLEDSSNRPGKFASGGAVVVDGSNCPVFGDDEETWLHRNDQWRPSIHAANRTGFVSAATGINTQHISNCIYKGIGNNVM
ncbi:hypothetical protein EJB05_23116 [Eragrostis curvula]|uniref:Uncharacterized protein n=1 Tax=Eragrostis curvula TaxID=38414 RepID=A0A5J9V5G7_9POAL|nr:hypothetical protein EJB05_23116 [Eragrostis curvula]